MNPYRTIEWISSDDQPDKEVTVLVSFMDPDIVSTGFWNGHEWRCHETGIGIGRYATPTHWAHLPHGAEHDRSRNRQSAIGGRQ